MAASDYPARPVSTLRDAVPIRGGRGRAKLLENLRRLGGDERLRRLTAATAVAKRR